MATLTKQRMTVREFLDWAAAQPEGRYELVNGEIIKMAPERLQHNVGKAEVWLVLRNALIAAGLANAVFTDGAAVVIDEDTSREPDAIVAAGNEHDLDGMTVDDPLILVELISPDSIKRDTVEKLSEYFSLPTVEHYLIVWQVEGHIDHYVRCGAGGTIKTTLRPGDRVRLEPPGIELDVAALLAAAR